MNSNKLKRKSGITLIALVITIIVMLILVAVTISMAINGGLFQKAGEAVGETQNKIDEEQELASGQVTIEETTYNSIDEYLGTITGGPITGNNGETFTAIYGETKTYTDGNGDTATIPAGFAVGTSEGINAVDTGLVIRDVNGNEFVWIPVTDDIGNVYDPNTTDYYYEPKELEDINSSSNAAYDSNDTLKYFYGENYYTYSEDFKYVEEYAEMVEKVNEHNGFYIGRYETTIDSKGNIGTEYNTPVVTAETTLFTKDSTNYPYRWYGLYYAQKNANVTGNGTYVQTAMIYGVLWEKTMQFIRDQKAAGNTTYDVDTATPAWHSASNGHTCLVNSAQANPGTTGDVALNIWDLESNAWEWGQEAYNAYGRRLYGGNFLYSMTTSGKCVGSNPNYSNSGISSRLVLYLQ